MAEFYLAPSAQVCERSQITDAEAASYYGPYMNKDTARAMAGLIKRGEIAPVKADQDAKEQAAAQQKAAAQQAAGAASTSRNVPYQRTASSSTHAGLISTAVIAGIVFVLGIIVASATSAHAALCNSGVGQFGQGLASAFGDNQPATDCGVVTGFHTFATVMAWLGGIWLAFSLLALFVLPRLAAAQKDTSRR